MENFNPQDRLGCNRISPNMRRFIEWVVEFELVDVSLSKGVWTWSNFRDNPAVAGST